MSFPETKKRFPAGRMSFPETKKRFPASRMSFPETKILFLTGRRTELPAKSGSVKIGRLFYGKKPVTNPDRSVPLPHYPLQISNDRILAPNPDPPTQTAPPRSPETLGPPRNQFKNSRQPYVLAAHFPARCTKNLIINYQLSIIHCIGCGLWSRNGI